jgi:hypothetical protein
MPKSNAEFKKLAAQNPEPGRIFVLQTVTGRVLTTDGPDGAKIPVVALGLQGRQMLQIFAEAYARKTGEPLSIVSYTRETEELVIPGRRYPLRGDETPAATH